MPIPGRPPQHQPFAEHGTPGAASPLDPYLTFVGAFLRQVIADVSSATESIQREAEAFLVDVERVAPWIELTGADVDTMHGALLRAAGLAAAAPRPRPPVPPLAAAARHLAAAGLSQSAIARQLGLSTTSVRRFLQ